MCPTCPTACAPLESLRCAAGERPLARPPLCACCCCPRCVPVIQPLECVEIALPLVVPALLLESLRLWGNASTELDASVGHVWKYKHQLHKNSPVDLWLVYLGRLVMGLAVGPCTVFVPMYCEEIAERSIRGAVGSYLDMMMVLGNIWVYTLGTFVPYFWFTLLSVVVPLLFVATFFWMPESPLFLLSKGRADEARRALRWLRGSQFDIQPEFDALLASVEKPAPEAREKASLLGLLRTNPFRSTTVRAFSIVLGLMFFQQMSGINVFIFYAVQIFNEAGSNLSGHVSAIITGVVHFVASLIASITVDRVGRRFLLLASSSVATVCLTALAVYSYLHSSGHDTTSYSWLPLAALLVYLSMYSVGFGTLTWFMMAELMPERSKGWASAVAVCFNRVLTLLLTKECPILMERVGQDVVYGAFAGFCLVACVFVWVCVPETKGKTKEEILEKLGGDKP
ncbi:Facilitated trehalose transporter Tret1 [Gryllus bimaculatus]|nr:Facilitated trehalose transporter Tret1 [Gryllus bimaculatus]